MNVQSILGGKGGGVVTVVAGTSIADAAMHMRDHRVGALIVSEDGQHIDGIVSERDVARGLHEHGAGLLAEPVSSVMTAEVHTCSLHMSVHDLARTMTDHRVRHVPVVEDGALVGIVSIGDVVKARLDELEEERKQLVDYIQSP